jgi:flagellar basal-body rod protein FlgF
MPDGMMIAASAMAGLERELEVCAKNIANSRMPGFQPRQVTTKTFESELDDSGAKLVKTQENVSFEKGVVVPDAGNPLAVAIDGEGFFEVDAPGGAAYTRNGDFTLDQDGTLCTRAGYPVRGESGAIKATPGAGEVKIEASGSVRQGESEIGKLKLLDFDKKASLEPVSDTLFRPETGATPKSVDQTHLRPQALEYADDTGVSGLVDMIRIHRHYDAAQKALQAISDSYSQRIRSLG